jgi:hypothetical protein
MAARLRKTHQDDVRAKIRTSQLINRLQDHALGTLELEQSQIKAIEVLIRKTLPDLSSVQLSGDPDGAPIDYRLTAQAEINELFGPTPHLIQTRNG